MRRVLEGVGDVVDRKLGRTVDPASGLTTAALRNTPDTPLGADAAYEWRTRGEGPDPLAALWAFTPPASGVFPTLKPGG